ncbi:MAG: poly-gamma-glutamate biosynthesis protein [Acidimicrobiaceae bacterium]|nr:poly-gamma-glutamate biosynthesis protein [Acidimicrobiaceae bacterium]
MTPEQRPHPLHSGERRLARILQAVVVLGLVGLLFADLATQGEDESNGGQDDIAKTQPTVTPESSPTTLDQATPEPSPTSTRPWETGIDTTLATVPIGTFREFTLVATGDLISHGAVAERAANAAQQGWDFSPLFRRVRPILAGADLAICHLESPLSRNDNDLSFKGTFRVPSSLADAIAGAGYDGCSLASNHSLDSGPSSVSSTLHHLHRAGLATSGMAESAETAGPAWYEPGGIQVAHFSVTDLLNGRDLPFDPPWMVPNLDVDRVIAEARAARGDGAEFVVVSIHWGEEYQSALTERQRSAGSRLLAAPEVDLVLGHHAHVIQPVDITPKGAVVYGLGNFLTNQPGDENNPCRSCPPESQDGLIAWFQVQDVRGNGGIRIIDAGYVPTWVDREHSHEVVPIGVDEPDHVEPAILAASAARTAAVVEPSLRRLQFVAG